MQENDFEELLNSLGVSIPDRPFEHVDMREDDSFKGFHPAPIENTPTEIEAPVPARELSEADISEIFENNGYQETPEADAEEIIEDDYSLSAAQVLDEEEYPLQQEAVHNSEDTIISEEANETVHQNQLESTEVSATLIPENSPTLVIDESTSRFSGTEWYDEIRRQSIILAGLGGIGSNAALQIARMKPFKMVLYDPDKVEEVNMSGQLYQHMHINRFKTDACAEQIRSFTNAYSIYSIRSRYTKENEAGPVMICGFDNMEARKIFFNNWKRHVMNAENPEKCVFIDGRLSIDTLQVFCMRGDDDFYIQKYQNEYLFSDSEADETICSMKQTTYLACMIGSIITNLFTNFVASTLHPAIPYNLPFFTEYEAQSMKLKTENQWHL